MVDDDDEIPKEVELDDEEVDELLNETNEYDESDDRYNGGD